MNTNINVVCFDVDRFAIWNQMQCQIQTHDWTSIPWNWELTHLLPLVTHDLAPTGGSKWCGGVLQEQTLEVIVIQALWEHALEVAVIQRRSPQLPAR